MRAVIIGAVAGGASCAARLRRLNEQAVITLIDKGSDASFANCGMPYFLSGEIPRREDLLVTPNERLKTRYNIDLHLRTECLRIDRALKTVHVRRMETGENFAIPYDKLVIATGASPFVPPTLKLLDDVAKSRLLILRSLQDMDRIDSVIKQDKAKKALIIGAGYIGVEVAEALKHRGLDVTMVELANQVLPPFDMEMTRPIQDELLANGVQLKLFTTVNQLESTASQAAESAAASDHPLLTAMLADGSKVQCDFALVSVGVRPDSQIAQAASLQTGPRGGITTNEFCQTSDPDIYAVGDVTETTEYVTGAPHAQIPLAGPANRQGHITASHIAFTTSSGMNGHSYQGPKYRGTQGTCILRCFSKALALTGLSEKALKRDDALKSAYTKVYTHGGSHAGYFPGAGRMGLKLLFDRRDGRVLGGQVVGDAREGVDKRIDVIAMAIQGRMTVYDLEQAELAYSPVFGSAKDPINMLGFIGSGVMRGDQDLVFYDDGLGGESLEQLTASGKIRLLDVRTPGEYEKGHLEGAVNIPVDDLRKRISEVDGSNGAKDKLVVCYCGIGFRGYLAQKILRQHGFPNVKNLSGGFESVRKLYGKL